MYVEHISHTDIVQSVDLFFVCMVKVCEVREFKKNNVGVLLMSAKELLISLHQT